MRVGNHIKELHLRYLVENFEKLLKKKEQFRTKRRVKKITWEDFVFMAIMRT